MGANSKSTKFSGFPRGTQYTQAPSPLFGPLLEDIEDLRELKCTLRAIWRIRDNIRVHKGRRYVSGGELTTDIVLVKGVGTPAAIRSAMEHATERGTFIARTVDSDGEKQKVYFLNDEAGRKAAVTLAPVSDEEEPIAAVEGDETEASKPNIFKLYEENVGLLTPLIADQLKDAEETYPWSWIQQAFTIAVNGNKRNWRYIEATLRRWASEGKDDGESRRHTEETSDKDEFLEYLRKRGRLSST